MTFLNKYWIYIMLPLSVIFGWFVMGFLTDKYVVQPNQPYMIVDKDVPSEYCPVGYEPVELTGKPVDQGEKALISCKVPESYAQYIHYPDNWNENVLNPDTTQGQITKWILYGILAIVIGFVIWRSIILYNKYKKKQAGGI